MEDKQYRYKLLALGNPDQYDKWFEGWSYCILSEGECEHCPVYLPAPAPPKDSRCGRLRVFGIAKTPFCGAFKTCEECGLGCGPGEDIAEVTQRQLNRCEEVGLFECPGADQCWKGDDCTTCNFLPCRGCKSNRASV